MFEKCSETAVFCTFSLPNVRFATAARIFSTSKLHKVLPDHQFFNIFIVKCIFRHSGVQFLDIWTYKSAPNTSCFVHFHFQMCFSPQRREIFRHRNFKKCSEADEFWTFSLQNLFFATAACNFWFLLWPHDSAPAAVTGLLFDWPDTRIIEKTQHFATSLTFGADVFSFFWLSRYCIFFLPTWLPVSSTFQLSILSEVCYLNFLRLYASMYNIYCTYLWKSDPKRLKRLQYQIYWTIQLFTSVPLKPRPWWAWATWITWWRRPWPLNRQGRLELGHDFKGFLAHSSRAWSQCLDVRDVGILGASSLRVGSWT